MAILASKIMIDISPNLAAAKTETILRIVRAALERQQAAQKAQTSAGEVKRPVREQLDITTAAT